MPGCNQDFNDLSLGLPVGQAKSAVMRPGDPIASGKESESLTGIIVGDIVFNNNDIVQFTGTGVLGKTRRGKYYIETSAHNFIHVDK